MNTPWRQRAYFFPYPQNFLVTANPLHLYMYSQRNILMWFCLDLWWREREKAIPGAWIHDFLEVENITSKDYIPNRAGRRGLMGVLNPPHCKVSQVSSNHLCFWISWVCTSAVNVLSVPPARHAVGDYQTAAGPQPTPAIATSRRDCLCVPQALLKWELSHLSSINLTMFVRQNQLKMCPLHSRSCCPKSFQLGTYPPVLSSGAVNSSFWEISQVTGALWQPSGVGPAELLKGVCVVQIEQLFYPWKDTPVLLPEDLCTI